VDIDDTDHKVGMNTPEAKAKFQHMSKVEVHYGNSKTKVEAINADVPDPSIWDCLLVASDDFHPKVHGYDDVIWQKMKQHFPDMDGSLWFDDGHVSKRLNTLVVEGSTYYKRFGYIYHPKYMSYWCDNEYQMCGELLGRQPYFNQVILQHRHWTMTHTEDALVVRNRPPWDHDKNLFEARATRRFDLPLLDILICTLESRAKKLLWLRAKLQRQIDEANLTTNVKILWECDNGEMSVGAKRNKLVQRALAEYVVFVDDDDNVRGNYVGQIIQAIGNCEVDCVGIQGQRRAHGKEWKQFIHSIKYGKVCTDNKALYRPPNHLNPVRRAIALQFPFPDKDRGEDEDYAAAMAKAGVLKKEHMIGEDIYLYIPASQQTDEEILWTQ